MTTDAAVSGHLTDADRGELGGFLIAGGDVDAYGRGAALAAQVEAIVARHVAAAETRGYAKCWNAWVNGAALARPTDPTPDTRTKAEVMREAADRMRRALDPTHHDKADES